MEQLDKKDASQKVELYVNHQSEGDGEISLVNVFRNMGAKKKVFLRLIAILLIVGLIVPLFMAEISRKDPDTSAVVKLTYENVDGKTDEEKKPDRLSFSSSVIAAALDKTKLKDQISVSRVEANLKVEQLLTESVRQRIEVLQEQIKASGSTVGQAATIALEYEDTYIVTLNNGFGEEGSSRKVYLSSSEISDLLNNIIKEYNNYLYETKADYDLPEGDLSDAATGDLDYLESLDLIKTVMTAFKKYCDEKAELYPEYTSPSNGLTFSDLSAVISSFNDVDLNYLSATLISGGISKTPADLLNRLQFSLRNAKLELSKVEGNIASVQKIIDEYKNEIISVTGSDDQAKQNAMITTEYYNDMVLSQVELYDRQAELNQTIADLEKRVVAFGGEVSPEELAKADADFNKVYENATEVYELVTGYAKEFINSDTIMNGFMNTTSAQTKAESFFSPSNLKKAVIGGVAGAVIACCLWFAAGFIDEFRKEGRENA
ncbi:MAG: hypothetical protein IJM61_04385 [Firmicutes bacterium]|nr:hypothetical protein [Bacillota bacterium]